MKKLSAFATAAMLSISAFGQTYPSPTYNNVNVTGKINFAGGNGVTISPSNIYNPSVFVGPNSGVAYPSVNPWAVGVGAYSLYSLNQSQAEVTAIGTLSCVRLVDGNYNVCLGLHSMGADPHVNQSVAVGNDSARNSIGGSNWTALGANALRNGTTDMSVAVGSGALRGNSSSITFGGTVTPGDVITVQFICNATGACSNSPKSWSYTVVSGDTLYSIAQAFVNLINANSVQETAVNGNVLVALQARTAQATQSPIVSLDFTGSVTNGWKGQVNVTTSAGATETAVVGTGVNASSVTAIGTFAVDAAASQNLSNSVYIGSQVTPNLTNATENVYIGHAAGTNGTAVNDNTVIGTFGLQQNVTGSWNTVVGAWAGQNATGQNNVMVGTNAGQNMTTGTDNTIVGTYTSDSTSKGCITTGSSNVQLGRLSCVQSPTLNGQLSIQNAIYGSSNNGSYNTPSTGYIGIFQPSPIAMLDVKGRDTSSGTYAFRINDSNNKTLAYVKDDGTAFGGAYAVSDFTVQTANIGSTTLFTAPQSGMWCIAAFGNVTTAATTSSTLPSITVNWVSADNSTVQSYNIASSTGNTLATYNSGQTCAYIAAGSTLTYYTSGYASSGSTAMQYAIHVRAYFGAN